MNSDALPAGYERHPRQEFKVETVGDFFQDYCMTCTKTGVQDRKLPCPIQQHLLDNVRVPGDYWHPSLVALAPWSNHPGLTDMVMCTEYKPVPPRQDETQQTFLDALHTLADQDSSPFAFPDVSGEMTRHMSRKLRDADQED